VDIGTAESGHGETDHYWLTERTPGAQQATTGYVSSSRQNEHKFCHFSEVTTLWRYPNLFIIIIIIIIIIL